MLKNRIFLFSVLPLMILPGAVVHGQTALAECAAMENAEARLACYDTAMEETGASDLPVVRLPRAPRPSDSSTAAEPDGTQAMTDNFGLEGRESNLEEQKSYMVAAASYNDFTGWTIEFQNGQVWRQVGTDDYRISVGQRYIIQRALMGSFMLGNGVDNRKIRVSRVK